MNGCVYRTEDNKCKFWSDYGKGIVSYCDPCDCEEKTVSNADSIRAMSDEKLARHYAKRIAQCYGCEAVTEDDCFECQMEWLKAPVEGVQDGT